MSRPLISARVLAAYPDVIAEIGGSAVVPHGFAAAGLPMQIAGRQDIFMPELGLAALVEACARRLGDRDFGLRLTERLDISGYGAWGHYLLGAPSLGEALHRLGKAMRYHASHDAFRVQRTGDELRLSYGLSVAGCVGARHLAPQPVQLLGSLIRRYVGAEWRPLRVELSTPRPPRPTVYEDLFQCPVLFDKPAEAIVIERERAGCNGWPTTRAGLVSLSDLRRIVNRRAPKGMADGIRETIRMRLFDGEVDIDGVAASLGLGSRTLQRRLVDEGTTFRGLLAQVRTERARELLVETETPIIQIALDLGYSSSTHFARAFRKRTGLPPSRFRSMSNVSQADGHAIVATPSDQPCR